MAVSQAKTCSWAAYYLGALYAARAEQCNISDKLVLAAARVPSRGGTHNLFAVERANALGAPPLRQAGSLLSSARWRRHRAATASSL